MKNLETFSLNITRSQNIDNILTALAVCKNLMNISIPNVQFTKIGLKSISLLPKLESAEARRAHGYRLSKYSVFS